MKKVIIILFISLLVAGGSYYYYKHLHVQKKVKSKHIPTIEEIQRLRGIPVVVYKANYKDIKIYRSFIGTVEPKKVINITAKDRDTIKEVYVDVGDRVRKGDKLIRINRSTISAQLSAIQVKLNKAKKDLLRLKKLLEKGAVSRSDVENARVAYESIYSQYRVLKTQLSDRIIVSPIDGIVSYRNAQVGEVATSTVPLLKIISTKGNEIKLDIPETYIMEIKRGELATISVDSMPGKTYKGKVSVVYPIANPSKLFTVKVQIMQKNPLLAGMFARVKILVATYRNTLMVPLAAILEKNGKKYLFVVKGNKAQKRYISLGTVYKELVEVRNGIKKGELVVIEGGYYLSDGTKVRIVR